MSKNFEYELLLRVEAAEKKIEQIAGKMAKDLTAAENKVSKAATASFKQRLKEATLIGRLKAKEYKDEFDWEIKLSGMRGKEEQRQWDAEDKRHKQAMANAATEEAARVSANHAQILADQKARDARQKGLESAFKGGVPLDLAQEKERNRLLQLNLDIEKRIADIRDARISQNHSKILSEQQARDSRRSGIESAFKGGVPLDLAMEKERNRLALVNAEIEKRIGSILDQNLKKKQDAIKAEERRLAKGQAKYDRIYGGGGVPLDKMEAKQAAQDAATTARIEAEQLSTYRQKLDFLEQMRAKYGQVAAAARVLDTLEQDLSKFGSQKMVGGGGTVAQTYNATPAAQEDINAKMEESIRKQLDGAKEVADAQQHHRDVLSDVVKEHDKLKKNYTDPASRQAIDDATDSFKKQAEAIENSSAPIADQKKQLTTLRKETKEGLNEQLKTMNVVTENDKKANDDALSRAHRLLKARRDTDKIRYQDNQHIQDALEAAEKEHNAILLKLEADRLTMSKAMFAEKAQAAIAAAHAESDALIQAGAKAANAAAAKAAGHGRAVSMIFQTQQALEDFSYAGLRGAANNVAMMAANIGGNGGIIALLGIGVVQAGSYFGWWEKINESMAGALWKTEKQIELAKDLVKLQWENFDRTSGTAQDLAKFDPTKADTASLKEELRNTQTDIKFERERAATAMGLKATYEDLVRLANELGGMADIGGFDLGILSESPETIADNADAIRENLRFMGQSDEAYAEQLQIIAKIEAAVTATRKAGFSVSEEGLKAANDAAKEYSKTLADSIAKEASLKEKIKRTELAEPFLKLQKESVTVLKSQEDSLERQLSTSQKLAESARERALQAAAATEEYKRTAALSQMELQDRRSDLVAKEKMAELDKQAKEGMEWAANRKKGVEGWAEQRAKQLKAMGYNTGTVDSQLAAFKERLNAEYDVYVKNGQAKIEAAKKQATDQAEAEKKAREDSYKQLETNRAGMLGSQASTAELGGDFEKALRLTKEREEVLKDLRTREVDKVGRGSLADTDAAIAQVKALDEMITRGRETTEGLHNKIANKAEQDAAGFKQKLDEIIQKRQVIERLDMTKQDDINKMAQIIQQTEQLLNLRVRLAALSAVDDAGDAGDGEPVVGIPNQRGAGPIRPIPGPSPSDAGPNPQHRMGTGYSVTVNNSFPVSTSAAMASLSNHMANAAAASRIRQGLS